MGLKDQQLALKWIFENIEQFSGDNKRITISGGSAGAISTHFQVLSNESRKYFQNAIITSGTAENYWAFSEQSNHLKFAHQMAIDLNAPQDSFENLVEFLKTVSVDKLVGYGNILGFFRRRSSLLMTPVIESKNI